MKYISVVAYHNGEAVIIRDMEEFAGHFCYTVKQKPVQAHK